MLAAAISLKASFRTGLSHGEILTSDFLLRNLNDCFPITGWMLDIITVHPKKEILDYPQNRR